MVSLDRHHWLLLARPGPTSRRLERRTCTLPAYGTYTTNALGDRTRFTDRNGTTHAYVYDTLNRLVADNVTTLGAGIDGAVTSIDYFYNSQGLLEEIVSFGNAGITSDVLRTFNGLGQITAEYQSHSGSANLTSTPAVRYAYSGLSTGSRLANMTYPNGREIDYNYASGLDDAVGRLSGISDASGVLESYKYLGMDTVVVRSHPQTASACRTSRPPARLTATRATNTPGWTASTGW